MRKVRDVVLGPNSYLDDHPTAGWGHDMGMGQVTKQPKNGCAGVQGPALTHSIPTAMFWVIIVTTTTVAQ